MEEFIRIMFCKHFKKEIKSGDCWQCYKDGNCQYKNTTTCMGKNIEVKYTDRGKI